MHYVSDRTIDPMFTASNSTRSDVRPDRKGAFSRVRSDKREVKPSDPTVFTGIFGSVTRSDPRKQAEKPLRPDSDPNEFFGGLNPRGQQQ